MCAVQATWTLQLLVSTLLLKKILTTFQKEYGGVSSPCDRWDKSAKLENAEYNFNCSQLAGGVVGCAVRLNYNYTSKLKLKLSNQKT